MYMSTFYSTPRDWCISRQLWWGHRIPAYTATVKDAPSEGGIEEEWIVARTEEEALEKASKKYGAPKDKITLTQGQSWSACMYSTSTINSTHWVTVLEIMVSIQTLSEHLAFFPTQKVWVRHLAKHCLHKCSFDMHTHSDDTKSFVLHENVYLCFHYLLMHIYCGTSAVAHLL